MSQEFDYIISGGTVYDGSGKDGRPGDVALKGDRIAGVGRFPREAAREVIDASGLAVAPGFIDSHTHSDLPALLAPLAENRLYAGVTTEIAGNCGFSAAPLAEGQDRQLLDHYEGLVVSWRTLGEYLSHLEGVGSAVNRAFFVGFGNIRRTVMAGDVNRVPTAAEVSHMQRLLQEAVGTGAIGMSTGLIYPPGCYATTEEIARVASVLAGGRHVYSSHMRSEGDALFEALDEAVTIALEGGCRLHVSHLKVNGVSNWGKHQALRDWWAKRDLRGLQVSADRYPYCSGHTGLDTLLPAWTYEGGPREELKRLNDEAVWARIREEILASHPDESYWESVGIGSTYNVENKRFEGMRLSAAARVMGLDPVDAIRALLSADETRTMAMFFTMDEAAMREILAWEGVVVGSDSSCRSREGPTAVGFPHPRAYGTTGKILRLLVREEKVLTLGEAVRKMTSLPAEIFGLGARGTLEKGAYADVVVFDPATVADAATYENPAEYTVGVTDVFVNGRPVLKGGRITGELPGRVLRHGR